MGVFFMFFIGGFSLGTWLDYYGLAVLIGVILGLVVSVTLFIDMGNKAESRAADSNNQEVRKGYYFLIAGIVIVIGAISLAFYEDNRTPRYDQMCFEELNTYSIKCYNSCGFDNSDKTRECIKGCNLDLEQEKAKCITPNK